MDKTNAIIELLERIVQRLTEMDAKLNSVGEESAPLEVEPAPDKLSQYDMRYLRQHGLPEAHKFDGPTLRHILVCIRAGHGWCRFALNVLRQGWASEKQKNKLEEMRSKIVFTGRRSRMNVTEWDADGGDNSGGFDGGDLGGF